MVKIPEIKIRKDQTIYGAIPSKSNKDYTRLKAEYRRKFYLQCNRYRNARIKLFHLYIEFYLQSGSHDMDNALAQVLNCLQACGAIVNDKDLSVLVSEKYIDDRKPRIKFRLIPVEKLIQHHRPRPKRKVYFRGRRVS